MVVLEGLKSTVEICLVRRNFVRVRGGGRVRGFSIVTNTGKKIRSIFGGRVRGVGREGVCLNFVKPIDQLK